MLGTPVYELRENMPISEYTGWTEFFAYRREQERIAEEKSKGNLLTGDADDLLKGFKL
jgi:hypothetical protein